jgi:hypothetical protein
MFDATGDSVEGPWWWSTEPKYQAEVFVLGRQGLGYPSNPACGSADFFVPYPPRHFLAGARTLQEDFMSLATKQTQGAFGTQPVTTEPLTADQCRRHEDARWARHDAQVLRNYQGEFIVAYLRKVVAHGHVVEDVLAQAARVTGRRVEDLPVCRIDDPMQELPH